MKTTFYIILAVLITSCEARKPIKKPFVIINKNITYERDFGHYRYIDANGNKVEFSDRPDAYKIGDTIY